MTSYYFREIVIVWTPSVCTLPVGHHCTGCIAVHGAGLFKRPTGPEYDLSPKDSSMFSICLIYISTNIVSKNQGSSTDYRVLVGSKRFERLLGTFYLHVRRKLDFMAQSCE